MAEFPRNHPHWCPNCRNKTGVHDIATGVSLCANCGHEWTPRGRYVSLSVDMTDDEVVAALTRAGEDLEAELADE